MWDNTSNTWLVTRDTWWNGNETWNLLPATILRGGGVRGPEAGLLVAGVGEVVELVVELRHVGQDGQPVRGRAWRHAAWRGTWHVTRTPGHVAHVQQRGDAQSVLRSLEGELAVPEILRNVFIVFHCRERRDIGYGYEDHTAIMRQHVMHKKEEILDSALVSARAHLICHL